MIARRRTEKKRTARARRACIEIKEY